MFEVMVWAKTGTGIVRGSSVESAMRTVVIVLLDPARDAQLRLSEVLVFVEPHLLFFQAAMEPFDVAVALGMVVGGAPMRDAQTGSGFRHNGPT